MKKTKEGTRMCNYAYDLDAVQAAAQKFWDGGGHMVVTDEIRECIRRAYKDLTVRTMTRRDTVEEENLAATDKDLYKAVVAWMKDTARLDFDDWHEETCEKVIAHLKKKYVDEDCTVGKAQKIVNMTFKNLYAKYVTEGKDTSRFASCHLPLDSFTLEWAYRALGIVKVHTASWSAIKVYGYAPKNDRYKTGNGWFYTYFSIQDKIRTYFQNKSVTPLQAEFVIWPNIQFEMAAEGFYAQLLKNLDEKTQKAKNAEFKKKSISDKRDRIKNSI